MRVWWASSRKGGEQAWERALSLDPGLAAAALRLALSRFDTTVGERQAEWPVARELFQRASDHRSALGPRDATLLDAVTPLFERRGEGIAKARDALSAACTRFPRDAELAYWRALVSDDVAESLASLDRALAIDDGFGEAYRLKAALLANRGDDKPAVEVARACVAKLPRASFCEEFLVHRSLEGSDCAQAEADARRWLSAAPQLEGPYEALAQALYAQGAPREAVAEASRQSIERMSPSERTAWGRRREADLAVAYGDFEAVLATWKKWEEENPGVADTGTRAESTAGQIEALDELGRTAEADRMAGDFARRAAVLSDLKSTRNDLLIAIFSRAWKAGLVTEAEYRKRRDTPPLSRLVQMNPELWWVQRFGSVWSKAEADEALREAKTIPAPGETGEEATWALVFATAGDAKKAIPYLRVGAKRCDRLRLALDYVRQSKLLGTLLEAEGDAAGAREAYERVIATWGGAKKSTTVEDVKRRLARLPKGK
jgi:tetratricopeptide (TPR) repeat protein